MTPKFGNISSQTVTVRKSDSLPKKTANAPRRNWNVTRAFSAIQQNHNLNPLCSAVRPKQVCSGCDGYG